MRVKVEHILNRECGSTRCRVEDFQATHAAEGGVSRAWRIRVCLRLRPLRG